jgi:hypothetical protein
MIQHWTAVGSLLDRRARRLDKYSRYNASEKGRARITRYRASPIGDVRCPDERGPLYVRTAGERLQWLHNVRKREKRQAALLQGLQDRLDAYNGRASRALVDPFGDDEVKAIGRLALQTVMGTGAGPRP